MSGSVRSRTSHASMPPGLTTRSMVIARAAGAASATTAPASKAISARDPARRQAPALTSVSPRGGYP